MNAYMRMSAVFIIGVSVLGCLNTQSQNKRKLNEDLSTAVELDSTDRKKLLLIEAVLNLPDVIKFSKIELIRKKYQNIHVLLKDSEFNDSIPPIYQNGFKLNVLKSLDSLKMSEQPCFAFTKLEIKGDEAYIQMIFDITGAIAFGKLNYIENHWVPDRKFIVGVR